MMDHSVPPEFLEQEMVNVMRGKYKVKNKDKKTDKLIKIRLLNGEDHYLYLHLEFQSQLENDFSERIFIYRSLIALRYQTQNITTFVVFTGQPPSEKHKVFEKDCFGSFTYYRYNSYVIFNQDPKELEESDNLFSLAVLAAKYTLDTEGDDQKRMVFKKKLYELAEKKQFPIDKIEELLSFVLDYMLLPDEMENEFAASVPSLSKLNSEKMVITRGKRQLAEIVSREIYGKPFEQMLEENRIELAVVKAELNAEMKAKIAEKEAELAKKDVEIEAELARKIAEKEAELAKKDVEIETELARKIAEKEAEKEAKI